MKTEDFQAKVILFSKYEHDGVPPIISVQTRYPRMIHSELMTHRVFSRNARSSRAVPVKTLTKEDVYIPHFMKNQPGMQSFEEFHIEDRLEIEEAWKEFARQTQQFCLYLADRGVHKQWANRPQEWFGYIDTLITSTEWDNFFELRDHPDAMPEIKFLAQAIKKAFDEAKPHILKKNEWHTPYILEDEKNFPLEDRLRLSVARSARVSYTPFDGNPQIEKETERYFKLLKNKPFHASPFEHQAKVAEYPFLMLQSNFKFPWEQYRKLIENNKKI